MAKLSGKGKGKWHDHTAFRRWKAKRARTDRIAAGSRRRNRGR